MSHPYFTEWSAISEETEICIQKKRASRLALDEPAQHLAKILAQVGELDQSL